MIFIIPLKGSLLNLRMTTMEFQVKFILYVTAKFLCSTIKYAYGRCWTVYWSKYIADFLENVIKLRNAGDLASVSGCMSFFIWSNSHLLVRKYLHTRTEELRELLIGRRQGRNYAEAQDFFFLKFYIFCI
ncbi:hypothetical protein M9H77_34851 [Catharanthus roseus]|uniref:Uncharacterized protein n=1 Tax=Catharanthus roseus TaxID=4058 RepID=A0ACB9ZMC1_CATRO|nr:hypothetical protein M9H77_34851 [Catharanthus roseus]